MKDVWEKPEGYVPFRWAKGGPKLLGPAGAPPGRQPAWQLCRAACTGATVATCRASIIGATKWATWYKYTRIRVKIKILLKKVKNKKNLV